MAGLPADISEENGDCPTAFPYPQAPPTQILSSTIIETVSTNI